MTQPKFSIVIPTRNRCETLGSAIETVITQSFTDFELVISDNNSQDKTKEVIEALSHEKIRYVNSGKDLSMTDNWNLALSEARGEYVILFGDDDGLLPNALSDLNELLAKHTYDAISWERCFYAWPSTKPIAFANQMIIPLRDDLRYWDSQNFLRDVIDFNGPYRSLPMLYSAVVRRSLLTEMKRKTGDYLFSINPDIYSGVSIAYLSESFLHSMRPFSVNGSSAKSNGTAWIFEGKKNKILTENRALNEESGQDWDPIVPDIRSVPCAVIDGFLASKKRLFPKDKMLEINRKKFLQVAISQAVLNVEDEWDDFRKKVLGSIGSDSGLQKDVLVHLEAKKQAGSYEIPVGYKTGVVGWEMTLNGHDFGLSTVFEAAQFMGKLLGDYKRPAVTSLPKNERLIEMKKQFKKFIKV